VPLDEIQVAIILDLTGHSISKPGMEDCVFAIGTEQATTAYNAVIEAESGARGIRIFPMSNDRVGGNMSDYHAFFINQRPYIFLTCGHGDHYHDSTDTIEQLDMPKVTRIASFLASLVATCADGREFSIDACGGTFREKEAAGLSRLLGESVRVDEAEHIIQALRRDL